MNRCIYLLFGDLEGLQVVANHAQFLFQFYDLPAKQIAGYKGSRLPPHRFLPERVLIPEDEHLVVSFFILTSKMPSYIQGVSK